MTLVTDRRPQNDRALVRGIGDVVRNRPRSHHRGCEVVIHDVHWRKMAFTDVLEVDPHGDDAVISGIGERPAKIAEGVIRPVRDWGSAG